jgi:hypothetical protein
MAFANMLTHPKSISPAKKKCWSGLLIAFGMCAWDTSLDLDTPGCLDRTHHNGVERVS